VVEDGFGLFKMHEWTRTCRHAWSGTFSGEHRLHAFAKPRRYAAVLRPVQIERRDRNWTTCESLKSLGRCVGWRAEQLPIIGQSLREDAGLGKGLVECRTIRSREHVPR
jgi:hypothetical protein